ncbi:MAG: GDP-mannose 4,6-dehydratase [Deltaproteobacteria bacterium]|nr:GDP-mannose 4,6-dehydratase [Deltaproteobacteria bacterium]MBI3075779.1 GDP-mannose 4,6-dehydratase [Deltaproteobacteria bacterium]
MPILVTGGAGFIGSHLVERLLREGHEVTILDDFNEFYPPEIKWRNVAAFRDDPRVRLHVGDITDLPRVEQVFRDRPLEAVVHLAARAGVRPSIAQPRLYEEVNVLGTLNLLECCRRLGVTRLLFGSSSSVYGISSKVPFTEDDPVSTPISPYAATKRAGELHCFTYAHLYGLQVTCLRFFTVYGERQRPEMAIHKFTRHIWRGEEVPVYGDGSSRRDYTYISDIVDGAMAALARPFPYEVVNLGGSRTVALLDLIRLIEQAVGRTARVVHHPEQPGDVPITSADVSRAEQLLGFRPRVSLEQGIDRFVRWFKNEYS